ncbi:PDZ domain-containing protein [uncultured Arthrobacter sp.]|uniref:PDZ domain-containing protein n=1 Tax=uncultured Arthrobacter sp. TaxID=114050 RepID=UPI0028D68079|nr:PDZ domain-containing protein [uncultured Arthrobacter sp.]
MNIGPADFDSERWWEDDPFSDGYGLGLVLHEVQQGQKTSWLVARILEGSPAAKSGIRAGNHIEAIGSFSAAEYDLEELALFLRRPHTEGWTVRAVNDKGESSDHSIVTQPLRQLMAADRLSVGPGGGLGGGGCVSCRSCRPTYFGYANCDPQHRRCEGRCMVA